MIVQIPCGKDCQHHTVDGWQNLVLAAVERSGGREISYSGLYGPDDHLVHSWLVAPDERDYVLVPAERPAPKKAEPHKPGEYRPQVWTGDGRGAWDPSVMARPVIEGEAEPFPEPAVSSRDKILPDTRPRAVREMVEHLEKHRWTVALLQYAEGHVPHATHGRPSPSPRASWGIRAERGGAAAVAVYRAESNGKTWKWDTLYLIAGRFLSYSGVTEFKEAVA